MPEHVDRVALVCRTGQPALSASQVLVEGRMSRPPVWGRLGRRFPCADVRMPVITSSSTCWTGVTDVTGTPTPAG